MADLTLDTDLIGPGGQGARVVQAQASEVLDRGEPVLLDPATNKYGLARANNIANAGVTGICISPAGAIDAHFSLLVIGPVILGATLLKGEVYVLSPTVGGGKIMPVGDLGVGDIVTILGVASSSTVLEFEPIITEIDHA